MPNHLSTAQVAQYQRDGYVFPVPAITPDEAEFYRRDLERFEAEYNQKATLAIRNKGHLKLMSLYRPIFEARVLDAVESVLGPNILCWGSSLFVKEPNDPAFIAWHQDSYYWGLDPDDVCSAWIAFAPSTVENGAMQVVPGSHRLPQQPHEKSPEGSLNMLYTSEEIAVPVDEKDAVTLTLAKGEMSLHHVKILHGSKPNRSDDRRYGYAIRYVAPHVKQRGDMNYATLVRGRDDYGYFGRDPEPRHDMDQRILDHIESVRPTNAARRPAAE